MFSTHTPEIREHAQSPEGFVDACAFVLATIRNPLDRAVRDCRDIREGDLTTLWGFKREAFEWCRDHGPAMFEWLRALPSAEDRLFYLSLVKGFGLPKAGFVLQLVWGEAGCIDSHNAKRFGLGLQQFSVPAGLGADARLRKVRLYLDVCKRLGGCETLWDGWCQYVADRQPTRYDDAEHVSRLHIEGVCGR